MSRTSNIDLNTARALVPSAYRVSEIVLRNHAGKEYDISRVVADFFITESIYRSTLTLNLSIRDDGNFMEQAGLTGQEWITVSLDRAPLVGDPQKVNLKFRVTEYPIFAKYNNNVQVYRLSAISDHAFVSKFKKVSRAFNGKISDFVRDVLKNDLNFTDLEVGPDASGSLAFIVPNMEPIDAMHWAIRRSFTEEGSPFYLYQTLDGKMHLKSQAELVRQEPYKKYQEGKFFQYDLDTNPEEAFTERALRILSIDSDLNLSKPLQGSNGAYASRTEYVDLATKTASYFKFDYLEKFQQFPRLEAYPLLSTRFEIENQRKASEYDRAKINYISLNSAAYADVGNYHSTTSRGLINYAQSQLETLDTQQHTLSLAGDFNLNCGKVIDLNLAPSIDPNSQKKNTTSSDNTSLDDYLSGSYLTSSVVHNFTEDYFVEVRVKRDTTSVESLSR